MPTKYSKKRKMRSVRKYSKRKMRSERKYSKRKNNKKKGGSAYTPQPEWAESENWKNLLVTADSAKDKLSVIYFSYKFPKQGMQKIPVIIAIKGQKFFEYSLEKGEPVGAPPTPTGIPVTRYRGGDYDLKLKQNSPFRFFSSVPLINSDTPPGQKQIIYKYEKYIRNDWEATALDENEIKILIKDIIIPLLNKNHDTNFKFIVPYNLNTPTSVGVSAAISAATAPSHAAPTSATGRVRPPSTQASVTDLISTYPLGPQGPPIHPR